MESIPGWKQITPLLNRVVIWGAGDQCRVDIPILNSLNIEILGFIDETKTILSPIKNVPLFHNIEDFVKSQSPEELMGLGSVIAIGNPFGNRRAQYTLLLESLGINALSFADSTARIRENVRFGKGLQIMPGATVCNDVTIGDNCIINTNSLIEHDCVLKNEIEIGPGAILTGRVTVNSNVWIGAGAVVLPRLTIGENSIVGAGAVVTKDIPKNVVVVGSPARFLRRI
jgi:sugar O-acyltransferase (sialic acid O-acetyltransferase NeuD family)